MERVILINISRLMVLPLLLICLLAATLLLAVSAASQDPPPNSKWRLTKVNFEGLKSQPPEKMIAASGLQVGQTVDFEMIKASSQRLSQTGLFGKVAYRYRYSSTQIELTFELEEKTTGKKKCQFDNFVWFSDKEVVDAVKRDIPDFDGSMQVSDFVGEEVRKSLARLLQEKKIAGEVGFEMDENLSYVFKVKGANLPICDFLFPGAKDELKKPLLEVLRQLFKTQYSKSEVGAYVKHALIPVYNQHGYLKAAIQQPQSSLSASGACANEPVFDDARQTVTYQVAVIEGPEYRMGQVTIMGLPEDEAARVKAAWGLKAGEVFDTSYFTVFHNKIAREGLIKQAKGLRAVRDLKLDDQKLTVDVLVKYER